MNQRIANKVNTLAVNLYKALGTVLLALILVGLVSYLAMQGFFFVSRGWLTPTVVSPTDPEILQLNAQLAQQAASRDKLLADRRELAARLEQAERMLGAEQDFQRRAAGGVPDEIPEVGLSGAPLAIGSLLKQAGLVPSTSEALRMVEQGGVRIDGSVVSDKGLKVGAGTCIVQVGKRKFARVTLTT